MGSRSHTVHLCILLIAIAAAISLVLAVYTMTAG